MRYDDLTEIQKDIIQRAYNCYKQNPVFLERMDLLTKGALLDLTDMPEMYRHYNDLLGDKELIYHAVPDGQKMRYWLNDAGIKLAKESEFFFERRWLESASLRLRKNEKSDDE